MIDFILQYAAESRNCYKGSRLGNQDGVVLIIVLITMMLLSILGVTLLDSTTSELKINGNSRNNQVSFYAADAALQFAQSYSNIYLTLYGTTTTWPAAGAGHELTSSFTDTSTSTGDYNRIILPGTTTTVQVKVELTGTGNLPAGFGIQEDSSLGGGTSFKANYFVVTAIANGPNNSSATVESQIAKVIPQ